MSGVLIHEFTHFSAIGRTWDIDDGVEASLHLAIHNSEQAIDNADSHEYFAEDPCSL
jgi:peptidyl-Lys metalloendopeptidase